MTAGVVTISNGEGGQAAWGLSPSLWKWRPPLDRECQGPLGSGDALLVATATELLDVGATHASPRSQAPSVTEVRKCRQDVGFSPTLREKFCGKKKIKIS